MKRFLKIIFSFDTTWFLIAIVIIGVIVSILGGVAKSEWDLYRGFSALNGAVIDTVDPRDAWYDSRYLSCATIMPMIVRDVPPEIIRQDCANAILQNVADGMYENRKDTIAPVPSQDEARRMIEQQGG